MASQTIRERQGLKRAHHPRQIDEEFRLHDGPLPDRTPPEADYLDALTMLEKSKPLFYLLLVAFVLALAALVIGDPEGALQVVRFR